MWSKTSLLALVAWVLLVFSCGDDGGGDKKDSGAGTGGTATGGTATGGVDGGGTGGVDGGGTGGVDGGGTGGINLGGTGGATTDAGCGDFGQVQECKDCLSSKCCKEAANCAAEADCTGMIECARKCPNPGDTSSQCVQTCAQTYNLGGNSYNGLILCMGQSCSSVCAYP